MFYFPSLYCISFINFIAHVIVKGNETRRLKMCDISTSFDSFVGETCLQLQNPVKREKQSNKVRCFPLFMPFGAKTSLFCYITKHTKKYEELKP